MSASLHKKREEYSAKWLEALNAGKSTFRYKKAINRIDLLLGKDAPYITVAYIHTKCCQLCDTHEGDLIDIDVALETMPIPRKDCKRKGGCVCRYTTIAKRDENDNLILKEDSLPKHIEVVENIYIDVDRPEEKNEFVFKEYNMNTKYGRRKAREQSAAYRDSLSPTERKDYDLNNTLIFLFIVGVFCLILYVLFGPGAVLKWLSR